VAKEYTRDASEYGQQLIADAIRSLGSGGGSTPSSENISDLLKIHIDVEQTEH